VCIGVVSVNLDENTAIKSEVTQRASAEIDVESLEEQLGSPEAVSDMLAQRGIAILDDEEMLGYECQVYTHDANTHKLKMWNYKGIPLKMVVKSQVGGEEQIVQQLVAKEAKFNIPVEQSHFEIPEGVQLTDAANLQRQMP
jgi:hypothetical protein